MSFYKGDTCTFNVSDPSNTGYTLKFGTVIDGITASSSLYSRTGDIFTLVIPEGYVGDRIQYYDSVTSNMGLMQQLPLIWYKFDVSYGTVVSNSGTLGAAGNGTIIGTGTPIITYDTTTSKRGSQSLYCNIYNNGSWYVRPPNVTLSSYTTYCVWIQLLDYSSYHGLCTPFSFTNNLILNDIRRHEVTLWSYNTDFDVHLLMNSWNQSHASPFEQTTTKAATRTFYDGIWRHLTITNGGGVTNLYCDGIKNANSAWSHDYQNNLSVPAANTNSFRIIGGAYQGTAKCRIDDYRIYNVMLSDAEILRIYQNENI